MSNKTEGLPSGANIDRATVRGFGDEWQRFDQSALPETERQRLFDAYFAVFPWHLITHESVGFDLGCGTGRWATLVAPQVATLHCVDPSEALEVARRNLQAHSNCVFHKAGVDAMPLPDASMDFGYSLGVLHHVPDTAAAIGSCVRKLKPGAPLLLYLYYAFDNRPVWYRWIWRVSEAGRFIISRLPHGLRYALSQVIAAGVYWPFTRAARLIELMGGKVDAFPLSSYRACSFYTMRTDALDRFGTRLEQRFTRPQIQEMMLRAGLENIVFSTATPFWCAVGYKARLIGQRNQSRGSSPP